MYRDLFELQKVETAQRAVEAVSRESEHYQQMVRSKKEFDEKKAQYMAIESDLTSLAEQLDAFPAQLEEAETKLAEERDALYDGSVINVKEMTARENQASALEDKIQELRALNALYSGEKTQKEQEQQALKVSMAKDYAFFKAAKEKYEQLKAEGDQQMQALEEQKAELIKTLDPAEVAWYDKVKHKCGGTPIARLNEDHVCGGCFTMVPPVVYHRAVGGQKTYCEKCGRVLFVEEVQE